MVKYTQTNCHERVKVLPISNKANMRLMFHAMISNESKVVVAERYGLALASDICCSLCKIGTPAMVYKD